MVYHMASKSSPLIMTDKQTDRFANAKVRLVQTVSAFRSWADSYPADQRSGEWECDYEQWPAITSAFISFLDSGAPQFWDTSTAELLLYILARDNEMEGLKRELITRPVHLLALSRVAISSTEAEARWQLADALGSVELTANDVEPLLEQFFHDGDEYVCRRALLALARQQSKMAESLALRAWNTEHQYQRMAALEALSAVNSPLLPSYLDLAQHDGRQHLVNFASELRTKQRSAGD